MHGKHQTPRKLLCGLKCKNALLFQWPWHIRERRKYSGLGGRCDGKGKQIDIDTPAEESLCGRNWRCCCWPGNRGATETLENQYKFASGFDSIFGCCQFTWRFAKKNQWQLNAYVKPTNPFRFDVLQVSFVAVPPKTNK